MNLAATEGRVIEIQAQADRRVGELQEELNQERIRNDKIIERAWEMMQAAPEDPDGMTTL